MKRPTAAIEQRIALARKAKRKQDRKSGKYEARRAVYWALRLGFLSRGVCADMGQGKCQGRVEAHHHRGYAKQHWLDVVWVCRRHHQHRENGESCTALSSTMN